MFPIDRRIGFEVVQTAACAPSPGPQGAPVFRLARLSLVDQADDPTRNSRAIVSLRAGGVEQSESPTCSDELPRRGRIAVFRQLWKLKGCGLDRFPGRMLREDILKRGVLLDEQCLPGRVDTFKFLRGWFVGSRESGFAEHHENR